MTLTMGKPLENRFFVIVQRSVFCVCPLRLPFIHLIIFFAIVVLIHELTCILKGIVQRNFLLPFFPLKRLILVLIDMARSDFNSCRIFMELFDQKIDSPLFMTAGSQN
jgi:hypothetical protein